MPSEAGKNLLRELERDLAGLRARDELRSFAQVAGVNLCSNDYLGLAEDPRLKEATLEAVSASPRMGGTGSRLLSGHDAVWDGLEEEFAAYARTEAALYFANGYAANIALLSSVAGRNDLVFSDELNHASLIDGIRLSRARKEIFPHRDLNALEAALRFHERESCRKLIVTESVFSMDGDVADVKTMQSLAKRYGANLVVDEAHATAVHGPSGSGIAAEAGLANEVFALVHTCGKALAGAGAFVCGARVLREFLINHARTLIFSTAMPPYMAGQIRAALGLARGMDSERRRLRENSLTLAAGLGSWTDDRPVLRTTAESPEALRRDMALLSAQGKRGEMAERAVASASDGHRRVPGAAKRTSQIVPVVIGSNEDALAAAAYLRGQGFAVRAIRPPTVPAGTARLRLSLTARITREHVTDILGALQNWRRLQSSLTAAEVAGRV